MTVLRQRSDTWKLLSIAFAICLVNYNKRKSSVSNRACELETGLNVEAARNSNSGSSSREEEERKVLKFYDIHPGRGVSFNFKFKGL